MVGRSFNISAGQDVSHASSLPLDATISDKGNIVLESENISISHDGKTTILDKFHLSLRQGEIVSILGPSGVGKSSLLRILGGLDQPKTGLVKIHNEVVSKVHPRLSMAFQNPCLLPWLNVHKNVAFGLDFKHQPKLDKALRHQRIERALQEVGLSGSEALLPAQLSGGMASRVALARCLARQPDVLLLDEPFGALDAITRSQMQELLIKIIADYQSAALLITHDIDEALRISDRVLLIGSTNGQLPGHLLGEWDLSALRQSGHNSEFTQKIHNEIMANLAH